MHRRKNFTIDYDAVGTPITAPPPPHRTVRAVFLHTALHLGLSHWALHAQWFSFVSYTENLSVASVFWRSAMRSRGKDARHEGKDIWGAMYYNFLEIL